MPTNALRIEKVLSDEEYAAIDAFASKIEGRGADALPELAGFLKENFRVSLELDSDIVVGFASDSSNLPGEATALARPRSERQCAVIMRACHAARVPVTLSGGKSNLTGSATPQGGLVLSTASMLDPEVSVDSDARLASCPPGVILEDLRSEVLKLSGKKLCFPVNPTSRADASVGGSIACNCSGFTPGETGAFRSWLESIRLLLPDGRLIAARRGEFLSEDGRFTLDEAEWPVPRYQRPRIKNAGGPFSAPEGAMDFIDLIVGSEGLFGLVTSCELKLAESPDDYLDIFFSLPNEAQALKFLSASLAHFDGDLSALSAFEYFGVNCRKYMDHEKRFFRGEDGVGMYVQEPLWGAEPEDAAGKWLQILGEAELDVDEDAIILLDSNRLRALFMEARHSVPANALEVVQHRGTFVIMTDTVVPAERFAEFLESTHALLTDAGLDYLSFGHLGDCHLHFTILPQESQVDAGVAAYDAIVAKSAELGGVYSGEHGTGKRKRKDFLRCYGSAAVEQVRACKAAVDPEMLLNRGNVFEV
jgi:D-lactate dehydrogenase (cytochrome)